MGIHFFGLCIMTDVFRYKSLFIVALPLMSVRRLLTETMAKRGNKTSNKRKTPTKAAQQKVATPTKQTVKQEPVKQENYQNCKYNVSRHPLVGIYATCAIYF